MRLRSIDHGCLLNHRSASYCLFQKSECTNVVIDHDCHLDQRGAFYGYFFFILVSEIRMRLRSIDHGCLLDHRGASYLSHCLTACLPVPNSRAALSKGGVTTVYQRKYSSNIHMDHILCPYLQIVNALHTSTR